MALQSSECLIIRFRRVELHRLPLAAQCGKIEYSQLSPGSSQGFCYAGKSMGLHSNCFRYVAVLVVVMFGLNAFDAHAQPLDEAIWKNVMEWLNKAPPVDGPRILFNLYQKQLIADGASAVGSSSRTSAAVT
jgi:hypothetical protein